MTDFTTMTEAEVTASVRDMITKGSHDLGAFPTSRWERIKAQAVDAKTYLATKLSNTKQRVVSFGDRHHWLRDVALGTAIFAYYMTVVFVMTILLTVALVATFDWLGWYE